MDLCICVSVFVCVCVCVCIGMCVSVLVCVTLKNTLDFRTHSGFTLRAGWGFHRNAEFYKVRQTTVTSQRIWDPLDLKEHFFAQGSGGCST